MNSQLCVHLPTLSLPGGMDHFSGSEDIDVATRRSGCPWGQRQYGYGCNLYWFQNKLLWLHIIRGAYRRGLTGSDCLSLLLELVPKKIPLTEELQLCFGYAIGDTRTESKWCTVYLGEGEVGRPPQTPETSAQDASNNHDKWFDEMSVYRNWKNVSTTVGTVKSAPWQAKTGALN